MVESYLCATLFVCPLIGSELLSRSIMTDEPKHLSGDPAVVNDLFKRLHEWQRQYVDDFFTIVQAGSEFNKQIAAFHERLLLVSLGTIGLSVTALTSFIPRIPAAGFPRHVFLSLIVPAWLSLLISAILSMATIGHTIVANATSHGNLNRLVQTYTFRQSLVPLRKLAEALSGTIKIDSEDRDASGVFSNLTEQVEKDLQEKDLEPSTKEPNQNQSLVKRMSQFAMFTLQVGLILLCISAIKLFLSF
jgi:hypothetical protein